MTGADQPEGVAIVGCGSVSRRYLRVLRHFDVLAVRRCADLDLDRARQRVEQFGLGLPCSLDQVLADESISVVVNLTPPALHAPITERALLAGKSVYSEKPLASTAADARRLAALARQQGLQLACAPDAPLGTSMQAAFAAVAAGVIGRPVHASASGLLPGHEAWHPDPEAYYHSRGGPLADVGPYHLSALVHLLGPVTSVTALARTGESERRVAVGPRAGQRIDISTPTTVSSLLEFASGPTAALTCSYDAAATTAPPIEVHGTEGSLLLPDPERYGGAVQVSRRDESGWSALPVPAGFDLDRGRGIGVADMVVAARSGGRPRACATLAIHVLDVIEAAMASVARRSRVAVESTCLPLEPVPADLSVYGWTGVDDPVEDARLAALR